jgi:hypothetical protein
MHFIKCRKNFIPIQYSKGIYIMPFSSLTSEPYKPTGIWSSILTYVVLLVVFLALPNFAMAHEECPAHSNGFGDFKGSRDGMPRPVPPDELMAELPPFPLGGLDLTETQRDKVFQIMYSVEPILHEKMKVIHKTMESFRLLTNSDQFNATKARLIADEHSKALADLLYIHTETQAKVWGILSEAQRSLLTEKIKQHEPKQ